MPSSGSLFTRGLLAIGLLVGFYMLAIGVAVGLLLLPLAEVVFAEVIHIKLALLCLIGSLMILWSIVPRIDRFEAPGPQLTPDENPELFKHLEEVAQQTNQQMPSEVYLVGDINAWVTERGGMMGIGSRRVMGLGLPLLQVLTVAELRAVLAHEFGHFHGGDTKLGPWIYKTRSAMGRTIQNLGATELGFMALIQLPFVAYSNLFLRVTHAISRAQEYAADKLAATTQGSKALADGLRKIHGAAMAYQPYFGNEVAPALEAGFHPPIATGFAKFIQTPQITEAIDKAVEHAMENDETDLYDTHPALKDRLNAIADIPEGDLDAKAPAITLLGDVDEAEKRLLQAILIPEIALKLTRLDWDSVGLKVFAPNWKSQSEAHAGAMKGLTAGTLPTTDADLAAWACKAVPDASSAPPEAQLGFGRQMLGAALTTRLLEQGWELECDPGAAVVLVNGEHRIEPFTKPETPEAWTELMASAGVADVALVAQGGDA